MSPKEEALAIGVMRSLVPERKQQSRGLVYEPELRKQVLQEMKALLTAKQVMI